MNREGYINLNSQLKRPLAKGWHRDKRRGRPESLERKAQKAEYQRTHRVEARMYMQRSNKRRRLRVLEGYGNCCACCGDRTLQFLALDHVDGGGYRQRKTGWGSYHCYIDAERRGFPSDYQVLCHNCNLAKGFYGACPHSAIRGIAEGF